jgi:hypothetical protein
LKRYSRVRHAPSELEYRGRPVPGRGASPPPRQYQRAVLAALGLSTRIVLIDWDRFEEPAPLFLDLFPSLMRSGSPRLNGKAGRYADSLEMLLRAGPGRFHRSYLERVLGDVSWREALTFFQLSAMQYLLAAAMDSDRLDRLVPACKARITICERALDIRRVH